MKTPTASETRANLNRLLEEVANSYEASQIRGRRHDAVLISKEGWSAVQETLHLLSVPGMRESIRVGLQTPLEETSEAPGW